MNQWSLFPRSLRQLVMIAFILVLVPLLVLAWQAWQSLNALSAQAELTNSMTQSEARRSEAMTNLALEMERSYRQYCVLDDIRLANLFSEQRENYRQMLDAHSPIISDRMLYQTLVHSLAEFSILDCQNSVPSNAASQQLEHFANENAQMQQATREVIFSRGQMLQQDIAERGQFFGWQTLVLFLLSLLLVILFTRMIIGPVKDIERMIKRLGEGRLLDEHDKVNGPRELRAIGLRITWLSERLRWLESQRHEFLKHISHELKTPLASLREGTDLLADRVAGPLTDAQSEIVSILDSSSRHLQRLIEQLLDYNRRITSDKLALTKVSPAALCEKVIAAHSLPARAKKMVTECHFCSADCLADPELLQTVLDNLYSNAVHYGPESGTIYLRSQVSGKALHIDVANSGTPITSPEREMIFEPFYQGSQPRKTSVKGSGLGLSIARDAVHRMNGELFLRETSEMEVCFTVVLPIFIEAEE